MPRINKARTAISAATICAALGLCIPVLKTHEGLKLTSYQDVGNVWTACYGQSGPKIKAGQTYTKQQCEDMLNSAAGQYMNAVASDLTVQLSPLTLAAHTDFAYNVGLGAYRKSKTLALTNSGHVAEGCSAMLNWRYIGKRDCSQEQGRPKGCYGLFLRREDEEMQCLKGTTNQ